MTKTLTTESKDDLFLISKACSSSQGRSIYLSSPNCSTESDNCPVRLLKIPTQVHVTSITKIPYMIIILLCYYYFSPIAHRTKKFLIMFFILFIFQKILVVVTIVNIIIKVIIK